MCSRNHAMANREAKKISIKQTLSGKSETKAMRTSVMYAGYAH